MQKTNRSIFKRRFHNMYNKTKNMLTTIKNRLSTGFKIIKTRLINIFRILGALIFISGTGATYVAGAWFTIIGFSSLSAGLQALLAIPAIFVLCGGIISLVICHPLIIFCIFLLFVQFLPSTNFIFSYISTFRQQIN